MRSDGKLYWATQNHDGDIFVRMYYGIYSRKEIESAYKNKMIYRVIPPYLASCREEAEDKVRIKLGIIKRR